MRNWVSNAVRKPACTFETTKSKGRQQMSKMFRLAVTGLFFMVVLAVNGSVMAVYAEEATGPTVESADYRKQAKDLLIDGEYQESYDLLMKNYEANKDDSETNFLLGQVTMALDRPEDAIKYYKAVLAKEPDEQRVRVELARAYASNRQRDLAKQELEAVMATNPPKVVGDNIQKYLAALNAQKDWSARTSVGYLFDTDVNVGPSSDTVLLFGKSFVVDPLTKKREDNGMVANLDIGYIYPFSRKFALQAEAQYNHAGYFHIDKFNSDVFSVSAGPSFRVSHLTASMPLLYNYVLLGSKRYYQGFGLSPQVQYSITQDLIATASWTGQFKQYYDYTIRTGSVWAANAGLKYFPTNKMFIQAGYTRFEEDTRKVFLDNAADTVSLGAYVTLPAGFSTFVQGQTTFTHYEAKEVWASRAREDVQYVANVNVAKAFGKSGFSLGVGYTYTRNDSNLGLFDYDRSQLTAQVTKVF